MSLTLGVFLILVTTLVAHACFIAARRPVGLGPTSDFLLSTFVLPAIIAGYAFGAGLVATSLTSVPPLGATVAVGIELAVFAAAWSALSAYRRRAAPATSPSEPELVPPEPAKAGATAAKRRTKGRLPRAA